MTSELREFPPSEIKLERLRKSGVVPFSSDVTAFAVILGLFLGLTACFKIGAGRLLSLTKTFFSSAAAGELTGTSADPQAVQRLSAAVWELNLLMLALVGAICVLVLLSGLLQTGFLITGQPLSINFARLLQGRVNILQGSLGRLVSCSCSILQLICWGGLFYLLFSYLLLEALPKIYGVDASMLNNDSASASGDPASASGLLQAAEGDVLFSPVYFPHWSKELNRLASGGVSVFHDALWVFWSSVLVFSFLMALLSRLMVVLSFRSQQRMTRNEVEAEYRELEQRPEIRRARAELGRVEQ